MTNTTRPPAPAGFDLIGEASFTDPAGLFATIRDESPVFFYQPIARWIVSRREDVERWITDFATFSNSGNFDPTTVPEAYRHRVAPDLLVQGMVSLDPPDHTVRRKVASGFHARAHACARARDCRPGPPAHRRLRGGRRVRPHERVCARAHDADDLRAARPPRRGRVLVPRHPLRQLPRPRRRAGADPRDEIAAVWDRYAAAHERLREIVDQRRDGDGTDVITEMAKARDAEGRPLLSTEWIALHVTELAAAGTDTTAQLICNAAGLLSRNEEPLAEAITDPELWVRVVEESLRQLPSAPFVSRRAHPRRRDRGRHDPPRATGVWFSLASASNESGGVRRAGALRHPSARSGRSLRVQQGPSCMPRARRARACRGPGRTAQRFVRATFPTYVSSPTSRSTSRPWRVLPIRLSMPVTWTPPRTVVGQMRRFACS